MRQNVFAMVNDINMTIIFMLLTDICNQSDLLHRMTRQFDLQHKEIKKKTCKSERLYNIYIYHPVPMTSLCILSLAHH